MASTKRSHSTFGSFISLTQTDLNSFASSRAEGRKSSWLTWLSVPNRTASGVHLLPRFTLLVSV